MKYCCTLTARLKAGEIADQERVQRSLTARIHFKTSKLVGPLKILKSVFPRVQVEEIHNIYAEYTIKTGFK